jgi:hypothetical protein
LILRITLEFQKIFTKCKKNVYYSKKLNTYEINGGKRSVSKGRKNHKNHKNHKSHKGHMSKKNKNNKRNHKNSHKNNHSRSNNSRMNNMRGGYGSAWISSQYSLGNINSPGMDSSSKDFSASQGVSRDILMNPPSMGLAGSGSAMGSLEGANVRSIGSPLV